MALTELRGGGSTSNSPFQTQLPHMCTPATSPGSPSEVGWLAKKKKKWKGGEKELYLWLPEQQSTSGFECVEQWDWDSE